MKPIITSLLDIDLYKINMLKMYFYHFSNSTAKFSFFCRNKNIIFTQEMFEEIKKQLKYITTLRFQEDEIKYIGNIRYHKDSIGFLEFLRMFQLNFDYLNVTLDSGQLSINAEGPLFQVTMWEIYTLAIVQEVYWKFTLSPEEYQNVVMKGITELNENLNNYFQNGPGFTLIEFGTRRRFNKEYQLNVLQTLKKYCGERLFGTSNILLAKELELRPCGTMAHEYICLGQGLKHVPIAESQRYMLQMWYREYGDSLGTALSDTLGTEKFLKDFTPDLAKLYDGVRHDSGDPLTWGNKIMEHYDKYNINYNDKVLFFSDSLTLKKATEIKKYFKDFWGHDKTSFGIGTALTNPVKVPLNNVMKMIFANTRPVAKISDEKGKELCQDLKYLEYLKWSIN
jgi:nicotinate phosphoribosyltransferase